MNLDIKWRGTPNFRKQRGVKKTSITLHWMAGTLAGTDRTFANPKTKTSTHYGIGGNKIHQYVDEQDYAFANGHTRANKTSISIEHEGGWLLKNGERAKPTPETHETSAHLVAAIARRHGLGTLVVGENVFPHKHWVATACPGSLDIDYIVSRANEINAKATEPEQAPIAPAKPRAQYMTVKAGQSYWTIAAASLRVPNTARYAPRILKESRRIQALNGKKPLAPGGKVRIK